MAIRFLRETAQPRQAFIRIQDNIIHLCVQDVLNEHSITKVLVGFGARNADRKKQKQVDALHEERCSQ
ncbi:MAG: hypothetical protein FWD45_03245 [Coriobacteriia bacterium]|nr:hypothetical protein [Coriobacteriia bacterium]